MGFGNDEADQAAALAREELAFAKELDARHWHLVGDLEQSLSDYYKNMSPEAYAGKAAGAFQQEYQKAKANVQKELARRGLNGSNLALFMTQNMELQAAQAKANIYSNADDYVANQKTAYVRGRDNVRGQNMNFRSNAANNASSTLMQAGQFKWSQFASMIETGAGLGTGYMNMRTKGG